VQLALDMQTGEQVAIKFLERTGRKMKTKHILRCGSDAQATAQRGHVSALEAVCLGHALPCWMAQCVQPACLSHTDSPAQGDELPSLRTDAAVLHRRAGSC
jgi:hypothetical protein